MDKYQLRDKAFGVIFSIILADSQKMEFTKMEVNKKLNSYYIIFIGTYVRKRYCQNNWNN